LVWGVLNSNILVEGVSKIQYFGMRAVKIKCFRMGVKTVVKMGKRHVFGPKKLFLPKGNVFVWWSRKFVGGAEDVGMDGVSKNQYFCMWGSRNSVKKTPPLHPAF